MTYLPVGVVMKKVAWFVGGVLTGLTCLSFAKASIPAGRLTDETAIYQRVSEIHVKKEAKIDLDSEVRALDSRESQFREELPLRGAAKRISQQKYRFSGK
jgi:hypothetical protein